MCFLFDVFCFCFFVCVWGGVVLWFRIALKDKQTNLHATTKTKTDKNKRLFVVVVVMLLLCVFMFVCLFVFLTFSCVNLCVRECVSFFVGVWVVGMCFIGLLLKRGQTNTHKTKTKKDNDKRLVLFVLRYFVVVCVHVCLFVCFSFFLCV